jgi:hypothetical protein
MWCALALRRPRPRERERERAGGIANRFRVPGPPGRCAPLLIHRQKAQRKRSFLSARFTDSIGHLSSALGTSDPIRRLGHAPPDRTTARHVSLRKCARAPRAIVHLHPSAGRQWPTSDEGQPAKPSGVMPMIGKGSKDRGFAEPTSPNQAKPYTALGTPAVYEDANF